MMARMKWRDFVMAASTASYLRPQLSITKLNSVLEDGAKISASDSRSLGSAGSRDRNQAEDALGGP